MTATVRRMEITQLRRGGLDRSDVARRGPSAVRSDVLDLAATTFMQLALITGIYGLTRGMRPGTAIAGGLAGVPVFMAIVATGVLVYFKRRDRW